MTRPIVALLGLLATVFIGSAAPRGNVAMIRLPALAVTGLEAPSGMATLDEARPTGTASALPRIIRRGDAQGPGQPEAEVPDVVTPPPAIDGLAKSSGKAGTGFFISSDGTLLTAAHVVSGCDRTQIVSQYVQRTWTSVVLTDEANDIAILKAADLRAPSTLRVASVRPVSDSLLVLGYPASAGLTVAAATWAGMENEKFPAGAGELADPAELLWISAPEVTHGYSGGPIFDPKLGAVVGMVKGEVEGGYLRLMPGMPASGIAIGPGINPMAELLNHQVPYVPVSLISSATQSNEAVARRATVHVLCWR